MEKLTIKSWAPDDQPREKLVAKGKASLSDAELIAIIIGSGNREESAVALSKRILQSVNGNIHKLAKLTIEKLMTFKGVGTAKSIAIITALELGKRRQLEIEREAIKRDGTKKRLTEISKQIADITEDHVLYSNLMTHIPAQARDHLQLDTYEPLRSAAKIRSI